MPKRFFFILIAAILTTGCATTPPTQTASTRPLTPEQLKAELTLDEILPRPTLTLPSTIASQDSEPPTEALVLYSRAVDDLLLSRPFDAAQSLQKAIELDPNSYDLYYALGQAELEGAHGASDQSFDAFEHAAALRPNDLQIHFFLARQYLARGDDNNAIRHLRLALQTSDYHQLVPGSAAVDLLLASILQHQGYDRAALDEYLKVSQRLASPSFDAAREPDMGILAVEPSLVFFQIGQLYEKHGDYANALAAYAPLAQSDPANFNMQASIVHLLLDMKQQDQATLRVADIVNRFAANSASLALLAEVCNAVGYDKEIEILQRLHQKDPDDRALLFTLVDVLNSQNRFDQALALLQAAADSHPDDSQIDERLFNFYLSRNDTASAARLLVVWLAAKPDSVRQIDPLFFDVTRALRQNSLRLAAFQKLQTPPSAQAAKLYLMAQLASRWQRDIFARNCIEAAVKISPPFAPAFRVEVDNIWGRPDLSEIQKIEACRDLAILAHSGGAPALAAEINGLSRIAQGQFPQAIASLERSIRLGGDSPDLYLTYAATLRSVGKNLQCEQTLWKLVAERPHYDEAWDSLYSFYIASGRENDALHVLTQWLGANPGSSGARLYQAIVEIQRGALQSVEAHLTSLMEDHSDDVDILRPVGLIYDRIGRSSDFLAMLQTLHDQQPGNLILVEFMVGIFNRDHRTDDAAALLEEARKTVGNDPDLLYELSALYHEIGQTRAWEQLLGEVLKIDPNNVPASNDLGFAWADAGKNLDAAEKMIRVAVAAEPDNQAFLDSLGWVLYKNGKFAEASNYFQQAIGPAAMPDPEILDHYGDDLFRLGRSVQAQEQWQHAILGLQNRQPIDDESRQLMASLQQKLSAAARGKSPAVAPLAPSR